MHPFDKEGCEILFNLLNDKGSIIITTNPAFDCWEEIFKDTILTGQTSSKGHYSLFSDNLLYFPLLFLIKNLLQILTLSSNYNG